MIPTHHQWRLTKEKIGARLTLIAPMVHRRRQPLPPFRVIPLSEARVDAAHSHDPEGAFDVPHDSYWGHADMNFVMHSSFSVPPDWDKRNLALHLPLGVLGDIFNHPESLVHIDYKPIASADRYHHTIPLYPQIADGAEHLVSLHGWTGLAGWPPDPNAKAKLYMGRPALVERCPDTLAFFQLASAAFDTLSHLGLHMPQAQGLLDALDTAFQALDTRDPMREAFYASVPNALHLLRDGVGQAGDTLDVTLHGIGHAHMDIAYLWTVDQIRLKNARTYSNVLRLMDRDPAFLFSHSQPALYEMTEQDYPQLFERIKARIAEGRWEVMGGMWVEPDLNIPGGEALVRQLKLGRGYFQDAFGDVETPVLWLPDTFGFPGQIPQLMRQAGLKWFVTNKLNWNQINRVPWSSHVWEGIDGSQVMAHILTTPREVQYLPFPTNYKSDLSADEVMGTVTHATGDHRDNLPICFGYGDGGGGPTEDLLAKAHAYAQMPGMPKLKMSTVHASMRAIETNRDRMPVWRGEHYMEGHRGVFTSQAWIKRANRKAEAALHEAEALAVMAGTRPKLTKAWKLLCLNQFHDIVTGTSIGAVYDDAKRDFYAIFSAAEDAAHSAARALSGPQPLVLNTAPTKGLRVVEAESSTDIPGQETDSGKLHWMPDLPAYSATPLADAQLPETPVTVGMQDGGAVLENAFLRVTVLPNGQLSSVLDRVRNREVLAEGQVGNQLQAFEDRPICWDAWDIDPHIEDRQDLIDTATEIEVIEQGPIRAAIRVVHHWRRSTITQTIRLTAGSRRIDFDTHADWHETHTLLKAAFPVAVSSPKALFDIQWGVIERATSRETAFDAARFEVPAQKWAQVSDATQAVALLNDCKYGYDIHRNVMRLTLIKCATSPDPQADQGDHRFTYALLPYDGQSREVLDHAAYDLNLPTRVTQTKDTGQATNRASFVSSAQPDVIIETLVPLPDGTGFEMRAFEARGAPVTARFVFAEAPSRVCCVDLLGSPIDRDITLDGTVLTLSVSPFEILSLQVWH